MKLTTILIGGAALVGLGFYLSRKFGAKREGDDDDGTVFYAKETETYGDKVHKASMFAVGAIKTGADKIAEGIKDIRSRDAVEIVKKGEETIEAAKEAAEGIVENIKDMAVSINIGGGIEGEGEGDSDKTDVFDSESEDEKFEEM